MNLLIDIGHPGHVHFFKHSIINLGKSGHKVYIVTRKKDVTLELLDDYGFEYEFISIAKRGFFFLVRELLEHDIKLFSFSKEKKIDLMLSVGGTFIVYPGLLLKIPTIVFSDTEHAKLSNTITYPFASRVCTPDCYFDDLGKKQIRYKGYHELAYLHPNHFTPDPTILDEIGLSINDSFFVLRFISWGASHDSGQHGFSFDQKQELVTKLSQYGKVLISSEGELDNEFKQFQFSLSPIKIHHLLAFSSLYIGEGATMATEAAVLGTPSIYVNTLTAGTIEELINKYKLLDRFVDGKKAIEKAIEIAQNPGYKAMQISKKTRFIEDKIDVTEWLTDFICHYETNK